MSKEPKEYRGQKDDKTKLQTKVDIRSDPAFNSDDGYETRHMNPSDDKEIVEYPHDLPYDSDIVSTKAHLKDSEEKQGHKLDPIPFLAQQDFDDGKSAGQEAQALAENGP